MAKKYKSVNDMIKDIESKTRSSANKIAEILKEDIKESINDNVYIYYDNIRAGHNVRNPYDRTGELYKKVIVKRGRGQASVEVTGHSESVLRDIETGETSWVNSVLAKLSERQRARPFMGKAMDKIDNNFDDYVIESLGEYGVHVRKKRR